jgi:hypothetical protein
MNQTPKGGRLLVILSSLRLAVVIMVTLGSTCAFATFYEMKHGTPAAQREIYQTRGFALLLALLGVNIFSVMVSRWPWKKHHIGFLIAHVGILTLLAGSLVSLRTGLDSNMALYEGETSDRVMLLEKALNVSIPGMGEQGTFPVAFEKDPPRPGHEQRFKVPGSDTTLVAEAFEPHVEVLESYEAAPTGSAAIHFSLQAPMATQDGWLVADDPTRGHLDLGMVSFAFERAASRDDAQRRVRAVEGRNHLTLVLTPDATLLYGATGASGVAATGTVALGQPVPTGWAAIGFTVDRALPTAVVKREVKPLPLPEKEERRMSAVRVRLESPTAHTEPTWLLWTELRTVSFGGSQASVAYRSPELPVPFRVTLIKFNSDKYPGSSMAATYESWVRVEDPERGVSEHHISMNHPLHYGGGWWPGSDYIFFQASFVEGTPMMSIFSVARAPGLPLVYVGVALIGIGVAWMFYLKPYLAKRQAAQALLIHRERESRNEAQSSPSADPARPRVPAEPASSGA